MMLRKQQRHSYKNTEFRIIYYAVYWILNSGISILNPISLYLLCNRFLEIFCLNSQNIARFIVFMLLYCHGYNKPT